MKENDVSPEVQAFMALPEVQAFKSIAVAASLEHAWRESIIPRKRRRAADAFIESELMKGVYSDVKRWPEVEAILQWQIIDCAKCTIVLFWIAVVIDVAAYIFMSSFRGTDAASIILSQLMMLWCFGASIPSNVVAVRKWRAAWSRSMLNPAFQELTKPEPQAIVPKGAQFLLWIVSPRANRRDSIAEINEHFELVKADHGLLCAHVFYWGEVFKTLWVSWGGEALKELAKWYFRDLFMK